MAPESRKSESRKIEFEGALGETLAAALELPAGPPRAGAVFAHCFSCTKDVKAAREISRALRDAGFAVLRFDFTGLGASEGDFANTNFSSNVADLEAAAAHMSREVAPARLMVGHSLGGAAAIVAGARLESVRAVATIGAPADASHVAAQLGEARATIEAEGEAVVDLAGRPFKIKKQFLEDLERATVRDAAANLKKPLLLLHAPRDETVGVDNASGLFAAAKHPKSFVSLDDANHLLTRAEDGRYAAAVIAAWAGRYVPEANAANAANAADPEDVGPEDAGDRPAAPAGGARAQSIPGRAFAVATSIDGWPMTIDAGVEDGGDGLGPNPTQTVEGALAACAAITMRMYAKRKDWPLDAVTVDVTRAPEADAHAAMALEKRVSVEGDLDDAQRARLLEIADKCPVHRMLTGEVSVSSSID
ncbi:MAG: alpha/beta fold hydrolase [Parvularculaceae bacterium]